MGQRKLIKRSFWGSVGDVVVFGGLADDLAGKVFALEAYGAVFGLDGDGVVVGDVAGDGSDAEGWGVLILALRKSPNARNDTSITITIREK